MPRKLPPAPKPATQLSPEEADLAKGRYLEALVNSGGLISEAVVSAGVEPTQLYKWRERDEEFRQMEEFAQGAIDDRLRAKINAMIEDGNERVIIAAMKKLKEFQPKSVKQLEVSGGITHEHVRKMSEEERALLITEAAGLIEDADVETD